MPEGVRQRAVQDGKINFVSVSQLQKFRGCNRAWWWRYVGGLPDKPASKGMIRGTEGHARIATYLKTGQNVLDPLEHLGIERGLIPEPGTDLLVEHPLTMLVHGVPLQGFIDLVNPRKGGCEITDWKFKADVTRWGATSSGLIDPDNDAGIQMLGYAEWARQAGITGHDEISLRHVSFQTQGRRDVQPTEAKISLTIVQEKWEKVAASVDGMRAAAKQTDAFEIKPNYNACDKYGGCAWRDRCLDPATKMAQGFKKLFEGAAKKGAAKQEAVSEGSVTPVSINQERASAGANMGMMDSLGIGAAPKAMNGHVVGTPEQPVSDAQFQKNLELQKIALEEEALARRKAVIAAAQAAPPMIVPPDAPKSDPALASVNPVVVSQGARIIQVNPNLIIEDHTGVAAEAAPTAVASPKKRGRAAKSPESRPTTDAVQPAASEEADTAPEDVKLYYHALPPGVATKSLLPYVIELEAALLKVFKLELVDIRTATDAQMGFNKWKGYLAKFAREKLPAAGSYHATRGDERVECVVDALSGVLPAGNYVVGV